MWDGDYRGYRVAQLLSELLGGEELISFTLHWTQEGQSQTATCPAALPSPDRPQKETRMLALSRVI